MTNASLTLASRGVYPRGSTFRTSDARIAPGVGKTAFMTRLIAHARTESCLDVVEPVFVEPRERITPRRQDAKTQRRKGRDHVDFESQTDERDNEKHEPHENGRTKKGQKDWW